MQKVSIAALAVVVVAGTILVAQDGAPPVAKTEQHRWLDQLVGEWNVAMSATMAPGAEPLKMEGTTSARSLGGLWLIAEGQVNFGGLPMNSILTVGYDPEKKTFVGTWVDTMQTHMYVYRGSLDEAKKTLTLEATGPSFEDPKKTAEFRDAFEVVSPDHVVLTSSLKGEDGKWTQFMRADYKRKKAETPKEK
jgi:hypothetical protein